MIYKIISHRRLRIVCLYRLFIRLRTSQNHIAQTIRRRTQTYKQTIRRRTQTYKQTSKSYRTDDTQTYKQTINRQHHTFYKIIPHIRSTKSYVLQNYHHHAVTYIMYGIYIHCSVYITPMSNRIHHDTSCRNTSHIHAYTHTHVKWIYIIDYHLCMCCTCMRNSHRVCIIHDTYIMYL